MGWRVSLCKGPGVPVLPCTLGPQAKGSGSMTGAVLLLLQVSCGLNHTAAVIELADDIAQEAAADLAKDSTDGGRLQMSAD
mgnify:CR=1 FL=1